MLPMLFVLIDWSILLTRLDKTLLGPTSTNLLVPWLVIYKTISLHLTLLTTCLASKALMISGSLSSLAVTFDTKGIEGRVMLMLLKIPEVFHQQVS